MICTLAWRCFPYLRTVGDQFTIHTRQHLDDVRDDIRVIAVRAMNWYRFLAAPRTNRVTTCAWWVSWIYRDRYVGCTPTTWTYDEKSARIMLMTSILWRLGLNLTNNSPQVGYSNHLLPGLTCTAMRATTMKLMHWRVVSHFLEY